MFDLSKYMSAEERIQLHSAENPDFRYDALYEFVTAKNGDIWVIVKAFIWRTEVDPLPWVTGLAAENMATQFAIEKAETSAYARAITNSGIQKFSTTKSGQLAPRANREEMEKVAAIENDKRLVKVSTVLDPHSPNTWGEPYNASEPITLGEGVTIVSEQLAAPKPVPMPNEDAPTCNHMNGKMLRTLKRGVSKTGKPYYGWVCAQVKDPRVGGDQCPAIWYRQDPVSGEWIKP